MTTQTSDAILYRVREPLRAGDVTLTWCSHHGSLVRHLYQPGKTPPLVCLECCPEAEVKRDE